MRRYRRRSKLIQAVQFDGTREGCHRLIAFTPAVTEPFEAEGIRVTTPRGPLAVLQGDWLVRDPDSAEVSVVTNEQFFRDFDHVGRP